ncbi:hypothetical protein HPB50_011390 [Hyalomma asiaticum]|uniref:Uncharacterized protein n=1 Tax=Hyalomma asiaticum TaxID=266040 RepID=A0ACB7T7G4_HYAAI|nr:hypothetical protein HPB50_011390 [Hyalomma asiaticum]
MRMRTTADKEIEDVLFLWFKRARSANFPISGPTLEEKTKEAASQIGIEDFRDSQGNKSFWMRKTTFAEVEEADILFNQVIQSTSLK